VLLLSQGLAQTEVAQRTGASPSSANKWSQHSRRDRLEGLLDKPRQGRPPTIPAEKIAQVIEMAVSVVSGRRASLLLAARGSLAPDAQPPILRSRLSSLGHGTPISSRCRWVLRR